MKKKKKWRKWKKLFFLDFQLAFFIELLYLTEVAVNLSSNG